MINGIQRLRSVLAMDPLHEILDQTAAGPVAINPLVLFCADAGGGGTSRGGGGGGGGAVDCANAKV